MFSFIQGAWIFRHKNSKSGEHILKEGEKSKILVQISLLVYYSKLFTKLG